tara:strand:+ start:1090 stop:1485 length:396 start_codon:yes stop_codon:yes gene_type:complete
MAKKFPDLTGDGKVTQKDILMGRGVSLAKGGQIVYSDKDKKKIKKVTKGLKKASNLHAKQAKMLSSIELKKGGKPKSRVNEAGNYTKPTMRKNLFNRIKAGSKGGNPGQWSARKAQMLAKEYKAKGGGYKS